METAAWDIRPMRKALCTTPQETTNSPEPVIHALWTALFLPGSVTHSGAFIQRHSRTHDYILKHNIFVLVYQKTNASLL